MMTREPSTPIMFQYAWFIPLLFFAVRLMMVITMPLDGLLGFGDLRHFYNLAQMGLPFIDYWVEFPPVFPFLSSLLYTLAGIREHAYFYMLVIILSIAQAVTIYVFIKLCGEIHQGMAAVWRIFLYTLITLGLSYGWWYFDPLAVLFHIVGDLFRRKRSRFPGWLGVGCRYPGQILSFACHSRGVALQRGEASVEDYPDCDWNIRLRVSWTLFDLSRKYGCIPGISAQ